MTISRGLGKNDDRHLYPDIVIDTNQKDDNGKTVIEVYDVKYKHFNPNYGVKREDLFQLHTYVLYLSNEYTIKRCGFIFPQKEGDSLIEDKANYIQHPQYPDGIPFNIIFFNIPNQMQEKTFVDIMKEHEKSFVDRIKNK